MMSEDDNAPPHGLVNGRSPLLTAFLYRRAALLHRLSHLQHMIDTAICTTLIVGEYNGLTATLSGRAR